MTTRFFVVLLASALAACSGLGGETRLAPPPDASLDIRTSCALAESRCSRCHTIDRVLAARVESPTHWQDYVHRMRLQPQSGILPDEEMPITRCLVARTFGASGLAQMMGSAR